MRVSLRWSMIVLVAVFLATTVAPAYAAPRAQAPTVTIIVLGFVDVAGGNDPACPGCNGEFDPEDVQAAAQNPLPPFTVIVRDGTGQELARQTTQPLTGLQRVSIDVPEDTRFEVSMEANPPGWFLCPTESRTRTLTSEDFQLGNALVEYHFWNGCASQPSPTPIVTVEPGTAEPTTAPPAATEPPPSGGEGEGGAQAPSEAPALGSIRGLAFIDADQDGALAPSEPGLNDVGVHLGGGGIELYTVTNAAGQYSFDGLGEGQYDVWVAPGAEWRVTTSSKYSAVQVVGGEAVLGIDFGMVREGEEVVEAETAGEDLVVPPGTGIRLPATGVAAMSGSQTLAVLAILLLGLGLLGFSSEQLTRR